MVADQTGYPVEGEIWKIPEFAFEKLDAYEGSEYARNKISVICAFGRLKANAYLWIASTAGLEDVGRRWREQGS